MAIQATGDSSLVADRASSRRIGLSGYISTAAVSALNIVAVIAVTGLLARVWDERQFLLYGTTNRYLNFLFCFTSGSLGYAIVRNATSPDPARRRRVLFNAVFLASVLTGLLCAALLMLLPGISAALQEPAFTTSWVPLCALWLGGQSLLHALLAYLRSSDQLQLANRIHWISKSLFILAAAVLIAQFPGAGVPAYYGIVGGLILAACAAGLWAQRASADAVLDLRLCGDMLAFSSSRMADAVLKSSFLVVLITVLSVNGAGRIAGQIAVITFMLRGIEALCQPLVMLVMTDSIARGSRKRVRDMIESTWLALLIMLTPLMLGLYFLREPIVELYLGQRYSGLAMEFGVISLSLLPTVAVVLFRGHLDGRLQVSPVMYANVFAVAAIALTTAALLSSGKLSLLAITIAIVGIRWVQFAFILWVLRQTFGMSLYRHEVLLRLIRRIRSRF